MHNFRGREIIVTILGAIFIIIAIFASQPTVAHEYPAVSIVCEIDNDADLVFCSDYNGNVWCFDGAEDWFCGDVVAMMMNDGGTEEIYDDKIVSVRYAGSIAVG